MLSSNTKIQFINHASVKISYDEVSVLSDPWYSGDAFHKGWNLLVELSIEEVKKVLDNVTHIWISHEHPDHFSVSFFKYYEELIKNLDIVILFQETRDKRVQKFFKKNGFNFHELKFEQPFQISKNFKITCIEDGFYDSALFIETKDKRILNLNDCNVTSEARASEIFKVTGKCDVLLTQFSYAAWKGGKKNIAWRELAANEKLNSIALQVRKFQPKHVIPFASFIYFSNEYNKYLNDSINLPMDVLNKLKDTNVQVNILKPFDYLDENNSSQRNKKSINYWENVFSNISSNKYNKYNIVEIEELQQLFKKYQKRIFINNNKYFIKLARLLSPIKVFQPIIIKLKDTDKTIVLDLFLNNLKPTSLSPDLIMSSESLKFILNFPFGFDTLSVNGCFEEENRGGFIKATKSLALESLNNIGIFFRPSIFLNLIVIFVFLRKLKEIRSKLN